VKSVMDEILESEETKLLANWKIDWKKPFFAIGKRKGKEKFNKG